MTAQERTLIALIRSKQDPEHAAKIALQSIEALSKKRPPREKRALSTHRARHVVRQ